MAVYHYHTDHELIKLLNIGDGGAFTEIYNRYWDKLFIVAANRLDNKEEAKELVQEVFYNLWKRRASVEITQNLSVYLATAIKYELLNLLASKNRRQLYQRYKEHSESHHFSDITRQYLDFEILQQQLAASVKKLPEKCRLVYELSREAGLNNKQIAARMAISENTVEVHLTKALRKLKTSLGHFLKLLLSTTIFLGLSIGIAFS